ncbi:MAG: hypothetical protein IBX69_18835, partial [Anaerolineales bacterium]|nr:hypothetical protein [Anaerolineales bacterium]
MLSVFFNRVISIFLLAGIFGLIIASCSDDGVSSITEGEPEPDKNQEILIDSEPDRQPVTIKPLDNPIFGIEMHAITEERGLDQMKAAGAYWVRRNAILWSD